MNLAATTMVGRSVDWEYYNAKFYFIIRPDIAKA